MTMAETDENRVEDSPQPDPLLSGEATKSLLDLLLNCGYLHSHPRPIVADPKRTDKDVPSRFSATDSECEVVFLREGEGDSIICCTYPVLERKLRAELRTAGGRCPMRGIVEALRLSSNEPILRILQKHETKDLFQQGDELLSSEYLDTLAQDVFSQVLSKTEDKSSGRVLISELASNKFHLPMDITLKSLEERLSSIEGLRILKLEAGATLVSTEYMASFKTEVLECFAALKEPTHISDICQSYHWDAGLVASWVQEGCQKKTLSGDFHGGSNSNNFDVGSMYTPHAHVEKQRQAVDELFTAQGYMTASRGAALGLSKSKMGQYIKESFPSSIIVSETLVVSADAILSPLEAVIQEAISVDSFVDLTNHVPADILEQEEDTKLILNNHVLPALMEGEEAASSSSKNKNKQIAKTDTAPLGLVIISATGGLFVSAGMIQNFRKKVLPGLIDDYAKDRAKEMDAAEAAGENASSKSKSTASKKKGRKGKKGSKASSEEGPCDEHSADVVSLLRVLKAIGNEHPELMEADPSTKESLELVDSNGLHWESKSDEGSGNATAVCNDGLICELCRMAFYTEDFISSCQRAVEHELKALQSARASKASVSRKDAATKFRNVEGAFEEAFVNACNLLQTQAKFLQYVETDGSNKELAEKLTREFLSGCCADFTTRLTQYCLFKNEVDPAIFQFIAEGESSSLSDGGEEKTEDDVGMPSYCVSPNLATRQYPSIFLRLNTDDNADNKASKSTDPLPKLREVLPGSIGVALARQWVMCGGSTYQGGTKIDESGNEFTRPGDLEKFMAHVEENCLSLCGLPFKKLDKKSEKQFLFARRQQLLRMLEETPTEEAGKVLDLTILLLFQQAKNLVAFGSTLYPDVLKLLLGERKISDEIGEALTKLSEGVESAVDTALVNTVKECGLSRDIAKHKIT